MSKWGQDTGFLFLLVWCFFSFKCYEVWQEMCEFNTAITIAQLLGLTVVSAKSKIHSPRRGYLSPGNSILLEITAALLFISITNSCRFRGSFVENQARFQQTCLFSWFMHALPIGTTDLHSSRDHEVREHIPRTWASSNDNFFQSNFSAWSNCEAILGKTPNWPI